MSKNSIWPIDRILSGANTPGQSGPGRNGNDFLYLTKVTYSESSYPSLKMQSVYSTAPVDWADQQLSSDRTPCAYKKEDNDISSRSCSHGPFLKITFLINISIYINFSYNAIIIKYFIILLSASFSLQLYQNAFRAGDLQPMLSNVLKDEKKPCFLSHRKHVAEN